MYLKPYEFETFALSILMKTSICILIGIVLGFMLALISENLFFIM